MFSLVIATAAALSAARGVLVFSSSRLVDETIAHSRELDAMLRSAAEFVAQSRTAQGRFPSRSEFEAWASELPDRAYSAKYVEYSLGSFPEEVLAKFGPPAGEAFLLTIWRGEWNEYYASWADRSTLSFDRPEYFMFGSRWLDSLAFGTASLVLAWAAFATCTHVAIRDVQGRVGGSL
jgi:hypothetical protein